MPTIIRMKHKLVQNFLLLGRHDINVSAGVAAEWFARLDAPHKQLVWFEHSAHEMLVEEPGKAFLTLINEVRPHAGSAAPPAAEAEPPVPSTRSTR